MKNTQTKNSKNANEDLDSIRLDKFLKISRIIKRRSVAKDFCDTDRVWVNERDAKASSKIRLNDIVTIKFGNNLLKFKVTDLKLSTKKDDAKEMYEILEEKRVDNVEN